MAKHLLFDFDGTLVDSAAGILAGFAAALAACKLKSVVPLQASLIGPPLRETLRRISGRDDEDTIERLAQAFRDDYDGVNYRRTVAYPGIDAALRRLQTRGTTLHIVTNKRMVPTERILEHLGWTPLFADVFTLDGVDPPAADKTELVRRLLAGRSLAAADALLVGDTPADGAAAARNGLAFVAAPWGYGRFDGSASASARTLRVPADIAALA